MTVLAAHRLIPSPPGGELDGGRQRFRVPAFVERMKMKMFSSLLNLSMRVCLSCNRSYTTSYMHHRNYTISSCEQYTERQ